MLGSSRRGTRRVLCSAILLALFAAHARASAAAPARQTSGAGAVAAVRSFYRHHFSNGFCCFDEGGLKRRRAWFAPELYAAMLREVRKEVPPDEVPYFNGDPFTDSQENPTDFSVGRSTVRGARATVSVSMRWTDGKKKVYERRTFRVELRRLAGGWKIANIFYRDGRNLLGDLKGAG